MTGIHAVRVAASLRRELQIEVETVHGRYGEYKVLVDGDVVVDGSARVALGLVPSAGDILSAVRARLAR